MAKTIYISEQCATPVFAIGTAETMRKQGYTAVVAQQGPKDWRVFGWK